MANSLGLGRDRGAATYERGRKAEGLDMIADFLQLYSQNWTTNYAAVGDYYLAQDLLEKGERKDALELLYPSYWDSGYDRIADLIQSMTMDSPQGRS